MRRLLPIFALLMLAPFAKAQGTFTALTCQRLDVNAVVNGPTHIAVDGDTIIIPAGSCSWASGVVVPVGIGITIIGAGTPNSTPATKSASPSCTSVVITRNFNGQAFKMSPVFGNSTSRISCMDLVPIIPIPGCTTSCAPPITIFGTCTVSGCPNIRIDNITAPSSWAGHGISDDAFAVTDNVFGVVDHNTIGDVAASSNGLVLLNVGHGRWQGVNGFGDNSWATADTFGTNQQIYIESNTFNFAVGTDTDFYGPNGGGGRFTCRFNVFNHISNDTNCTNHGTDTTGRVRSGRQMEFYANTATCDTSNCNSLVGSRGGAELAFGNQLTSGGVNHVTGLDTDRRWNHGPANPWGYCNGSQPWDINDGVTYYSGTVGSASTSGNSYIINDASVTGSWNPPSGAPYSFYDVTKAFGYEIISSSAATFTVYTGAPGTDIPASGDSYQIRRSTVCMDQPARGAGVLLTGSDGFAPTIGGFLNPVVQSTGLPGPVNEVIDPIYVWTNSTSGGATITNALSSDSNSLIANRDFYTENVNQSAQTTPSAPFNGTAGVGHGTLANRPTTCTTGVGYYATDQGSWNTSGLNFPGQSFSNGLLYVCSAPNTWTLKYTPFTMPHPLTIAGGAPGVSFSPSSVVFGNVPVNTSATPINVTLTNTGPATLTISAMSLTSNPPFTFSTSPSSNCGGSIAGGGTCTITFNFSPTGVQAYSGTFSMTDNASGSPHTLAVTGTGTGSVIFLNPNAINFGNQAVGTTSALQTVTLQNTGNVNMTIISILSGDPVQFPVTNVGAGSCVAAGNNLAPSASCTFQVTFHPSGAGAISNFITVTSSGLNSPGTVSVLGVGLTIVGPTGCLLNPGVLIQGVLIQ